MRRNVSLASLTLAALLIAGCEKPGTTEPTIEAGTLSGLTVSISGNSWVSSAGTEYYTASVSGGNGNYYYTWYTQSCNEYPDDTEWCENDPYPSWVHAQGSGLYQTSRYRGIYDLKVRVTVYVSEIGGSKTGSAEFWQYGPNEIPCSPFC